MDSTTNSTRHQAEVLQGFDQLPDDAKVRIGVVAALHNVSEITVRRWLRAGTLPPPQRLSSRCTVWRVGDLRRSLATTAA